MAVRITEAVRLAEKLIASANEKYTWSQVYWSIGY